MMGIVQKIVLLFLLASQFLFAQAKSNGEIHFNSQRKNANLTIDHFGNVYIYTSRVIDKYNSSGKLLYTYSITNSSSITSIDVVNPLRILVFLKDINQLLFLDNTLSETGIVLNLNTIELPLTTLVCNSSSKGFWLFDSQNIELIHLSNSLETLSKSGNLALVLQRDLNVIGMKEFNNEVYLLSESSILVFDIFGTYSKEIPFACAQCVFTENAIYSCDTLLSSYQFKSRQVDTLLTFGEEEKGWRKTSNGKYLYSINEAGDVRIISVTK